MKANLSIVLDKDKLIRLDILKDIDLSEIDKYTTEFLSSREIREKHKEEIEEFLEQHKTFTDTFKRESNKKGSLVIVYEDENQELHRMRVLYREDQKKLDTNHLVTELFKTIRQTENPDFSIALINDFDFFLGSEFNRREIYKINLRKSSDPKARKRHNQRLVNLIRNKIQGDLDTNYEKGYFYLRLIDAYVEKKGYPTTKRVINTKTGKIILTNIPKEPVKIVKKQETKEIVSKPEEEQYYEDEDGQYSMFPIETKKVSKEQEHYGKYEHYIDNLPEKGKNR